MGGMENMSEETIPTSLPSGEETTPTQIVPEPSQADLEVSQFESGQVVPDQPMPGRSDVGQPSAPVAKNKKPSKRKRRAWLLYTILGLFALLLIALVSAFGGYLSGISMRQSAQSTQIAENAQEQFDLAMQDIEQQRFSQARQRLEYVLQLDPNNPEVLNRLSEVLLALNTTATPTLEPTAAQTPTPDLRAVQEIFEQAQQLLANKEWAKALDTLLNLRKSDPSFRTVDVDGMLYEALRNSGVEKITHADLEGGIYDLTLASRFGPLDAEAKGLLTWSGLYITGASFWGIDWSQAVSYFAQVAPQYPNLMDGSGMTAAERYRQALFEYGNQLAGSGKWCKAAETYQQSLSVAPNSQVEQAFAQASVQCAKASSPKTTPTTAPSP